MHKHASVHGTRLALHWQRLSLLQAERLHLQMVSSKRLVGAESLVISDGSIFPVFNYPAVCFWRSQVLLFTQRLLPHVSLVVCSINMLWQAIAGGRKTFVFLVFLTEHPVSYMVCCGSSFLVTGVERTNKHFTRFQGRFCRGISFPVFPAARGLWNYFVVPLMPSSCRWKITRSWCHILW